MSDFLIEAIEAYGDARVRNAMRDSGHRLFADEPQGTADDALENLRARLAQPAFDATPAQPVPAAGSEPVAWLPCRVCEGAGWVQDCIPGISVDDGARHCEACGGSGERNIPPRWIREELIQNLRQAQHEYSSGRFSGEDDDALAAIDEAENALLEAIRATPPRLWRHRTGGFGQRLLEHSPVSPPRSRYWSEDRRRPRRPTRCST